MGDPATPGGKAPTAPELPKDAPAALRDFVACTSAKLEQADGKLDWLGLPMAPSAKFATVPGKPGRIDITLSFGEYSPSVTLPVTISGGRLDVDTSQWPELLPGKDGVAGWVKQLNDWFAANGKQFGAPVLKGGKLTLVKEALAAAPAKGGVKAVPLPVRVGAVLLVLGTGVGVGIAVTRDDAHPAASAPATSESPAAAATTPGTTPATTPPATTGPPMTSASATTPTPTSSAGTSAPTTAATTEPATTDRATIPTLAPSTILPIAPSVYAGCIGLQHGSGQSWIIPTAVLENAVPGPYMMRFATGPTGAVVGEAQLSGEVLSGRITIMQFGDYGGLTITGPGGVAVDLGPLSATMPFHVTSTPVACDASTLPRPPVPGSTEPAPTAATDQRVIDFVTQLVGELDRGDTADAAAQLDPLVVQRYGAARCRSHLDALNPGPTGTGTSPARSVTIRGVTGPAPWDYTSDGRTATVDDVDTVDALIGTSSNTIHVHVPTGAEPTWFTDCGTPI